MKRLINLAVLLAVATGISVPTTGFAQRKTQTSGPRTYTVLVGLEQPHTGIGVNAYFPETVTIHEGDTVHWVQNSNEIHTVTFSDGVPFPELLLPTTPPADSGVSPLVFNPAAVEQVPVSGDYNGGIGAYANSGIMGREPGQIQEFDLTFPHAGTYVYACIVHGFAMSGKVVVVDADEDIPSPNQTMAEGRKEMAEVLSLVPGVIRSAADQVVAPIANGDGTMTHTVKLGYSETVAASYGDVEIDLMQFFPDKLTVRTGDTVTFEMSSYNIAPHTITFLNGEEEPSLAIFEGGFLYLNPDVFFPSGGGLLTRTGIFHSGLMLPIPGLSYSLVVGDMKPGLDDFICLLHDSSGMKGKLMVLGRRPDAGGMR